MKIRNENDRRSIELYQQIKNQLNDQYILFLGSLTEFISDSINEDALDIENKVESN